MGRADVGETRTTREAQGWLGGDATLRPVEIAHLDPRDGEPDLPAAIAGASDALMRAVDVAKRVAPTNAPVLLVGESGTGKAALARVIHRLSARHDRPVVTFDVSDVPVERLERKLFGCGDGSTGAATEPVGSLEAANASTLFVNDIGRLPLGLQASLLRALEKREVTPVGCKEPRPADVRLIAANARDLGTDVAAGRFRQDLYYRVGVVEIRLPPLRERREDIRHLAEAFVRSHGRSRFGGPPAITARALGRLEEHRWPGNVRELENVMARAAILAEGDTIDVDLLAFPSPEDGPGADHRDLRLDRALDRLEREMIVLALEQTNDVKVRAARRLGVSERTLWYKLRKHGLS
jgi:DNA-binding NtrC family response regulator